MATYTGKRLAGPAQLTTSTTAVYTATGDAVVKQILFNNTSSSAVSVTAYLVPVSAAASSANSIIYSLSIAPYSQIIWSADLPISAGEKISLLGNASSSVTYIVSGIEIA